MNARTATLGRAAVGALVALVLVAGLVAAVRHAPGDEPEGSGASPATTVAPAPGDTEPTTPTLPVSPVFADLQEQVAAIRGLEWLRPLDLQVVRPERLGEEVRRVLARDHDADRLAADEALLKLFDLIPPDTDLATLMPALLSEQVLGFYDSTTKQLFVGGAEGTEPDVATRFVIVHEMVHALTDQHFDFARRFRELERRGQTEELAAISGLAEGDATLSQLQWADAHLSRAQAAAALLGPGGSNEVLSRTPDYVRRALFFPYESGLAFVGALYAQGGFARVDDAYESPPTSTEHVLHPTTFAEPAMPPPPVLPGNLVGPGCRLLRQGALGEFDTRELLDRYLGASESARAGQGWNGDSFVLTRCPGGLALADRWRGDRPSDLVELTGALRKWAGEWSGGAVQADGRFTGPRGAGQVRQVGDTVELVAARDAADAQRLIEALG